MRVYTKNHLDIFAEGAAEYWSTFWETLDNHVRQIPEAETVFPTFLMPGPRSIHVLLNRWGLTVASRFADEWSVAKQWSNTDETQIDDSFSVTMVPQPEATAFEMMGFVATNESGDDEIAVMPWHFVRTESEVTTESFSTESAIASAKDVALFFTTQHLLGMQGATSENSPAAVAGRIRALAAEFENVLETATREEDVQAFLTLNPALLELRAIRIIPKMRLGDDYITDYVIELPGSEYVLVEIEAPSRMLYTSKNDSAAEMNHAVKQVEDWVEWAYDNRTYLASKLPGLHEPQGLVVMGRRSTLTDAAAKSLRRRNQLSVIKVRTFDELIDTALAAADNIARVG